VQRRLAAILVADVVGYSRLMSADEAGALHRLKEVRKSRIDPLLAAHGGRIIKLMGDGAIVESPSVVDAVQCALLTHDQMARAEDDAAVGLRFRIAVHLGDLMVDGDDVYGDGVNVAARLEALAEPGGLVVSETVREHVGAKVAVTFEDLGLHELKNIDRPVRVHKVMRSASCVDARPGAHGGDPAKPSVAVLPFINISGDPEQEYFSDGITEDLITDLSKISGLYVTARNSTFVYKGKAVDVQEASRKLAVRYILDGSVRKAGARVRITA
jgi:adenylate cyclase